MGPAFAADPEANKKIVIDFYEKGLNQKDFEAAAKHFGPRYIQHNPTAADGPEGFQRLVTFLKEKFPNSKSEIKRAVAEGDYVVLHVHSVREPASAVARSSISSGWRTAKSSSTGTSSRTSQRLPPTATRCSSRRQPGKNLRNGSASLKARATDGRRPSRRK
jgi:predicted SnoaL-like aldol condensation-catalyzing enzyme